MSFRSLPSLRELDRQAKDLHRAAEAGDQEILAAFTAFGQDVSLASAQLVLARSHDFASWARLTEAVQEEAIHGVDAWRPRNTRVSPPDDELCAVLAGERFLGRSAQARIALTTIEVYSTGFVLNIEWTLTEVPESFREWTRNDEIDCNPFGRIGSADRWPEGFKARLGVWFADGWAASNTNHAFPERGTPQAAIAPTIFRGGGQWGISGSEAHGTSRLYICPLPRPGELRCTVEWPAFDVSETTILDGTEIVAAAERVQPLA